MITFETQEDFEDAVMLVLHKRLCVNVEASDGYGWGRVNVMLNDVKSLEDIDSAGDSFNVTTS